MAHCLKRFLGNLDFDFDVVASQNYFRNATNVRDNRQSPSLVQHLPYKLSTTADTEEPIAVRKIRL